MLDIIEDTLKEWLEKIGMTHFCVKQISYFNMLGIVGWYFNGNIWKEPRINRGASKSFDGCASSRLIRSITFNITGLYLYAILKIMSHSSATVGVVRFLKSSYNDINIDRYLFH